MGKTQPWAYGACPRNAPRPPIAFTSDRDGSASPLDTQIFWPTGPVSQLRSVQAAGLFFASFAIEYETVNARLPPVLFLTIGKMPYRTLGYVVFMNGSSQLPSNAIAAFCFPSASPHQPAPSLSGVSARPFLIRPT